MQIFVLLHAMQRVARYANDVVVSLEKLMSALELNLIGCQLYYLVGRVVEFVFVVAGPSLLLLRERE